MFLRLKYECDFCGNKLDIYRFGHGADVNDVIKRPCLNKDAKGYGCRNWTYSLVSSEPFNKEKVMAERRRKANANKSKNTLDRWL